MATVRPARSAGRWEARLYLGADPLTGRERRISRTITAPNRREALREANRLELDLRDDDTPATEADTMATLLTRWLEVGARDWSPATAREHRRIVERQLLTPLGKLPVARVRTDTLDRLYGLLAERGGRCTNRPCPRPPGYCGQPGHKARCQRVACVAAWTCPTHGGACADLAPCEDTPCEHGAPLDADTVRRIHVVIRSALQQAVIWGWIRRNPAEHARPGKATTPPVAAPDDEDVLALLARAEEEDPRLAAYVALSIESGARRGAVHALRWSDWSGPREDGTSGLRLSRVISAGQEIEATAGKAVGEQVTLGPHVTAALSAHHDRMFERALAAEIELPTSAHMWSDDVDGATPWRPDSTSRRIRWLGLPTTLKSLRNKMATQLLATPGISPRVVAERGGWSQLHTMLRRYAAWVPASDAQAAGVVDRLITGGVTDS